MSNARDKANIPVLNFQSKGIDDNADATAITINSSEQVGIGKTSPASLLDVEGTSVVATFKSTNNNIVLRVKGSNATNGGGLGSTSSGDLVFSENLSEGMRLTSTGLGIGTSSPSQQLHVEGSGTTAAIIKSTGSSTAASVGAVNNSGTEGKILMYGSGQGAFGSLGSGQMALYSNAAGMSIMNNNASGAIKFSMENGAEKVRITSAGNVGIGTTSPTRQLTVSGSVSPVIAIVDTGTSGTPSLFFGDSSADNVGKIQYSNSDNSLATVVNGSEHMRITSAGNVGIGETAPLGKLHVKTADTGASAVSGNANELVIENTGNVGITLQSDNSGTGNLYFGDVANGSVGRISYSHADNSMIFNVNGTEKMRMRSDGALAIGKTGGTITDTGNYFGGNAGNNMVRAGGTVCGFNRETNDGTIIEFSGDGTVEGTISVSGSTVSYNGFTGTHWSRFQDNSTPTILRGTVLETLDEMCDWYNLHFDITTTTQDEDGNDVTNTHTEIVPHVLLDSQSDGDVITYNHEGIDVQATIVKENDVKHIMSKVSDTVDAKNVYGLFVAYDEDGEGYNDFYVASVGSFVVRIKSGETIAKGDLLQSNGDGTAKVQTDDNIKSSSFAKVLSTTIIETYEDGSYLVPCSLMC